MRKKNLKYLIVVPCYNEEENIESFYQQVKDIITPRYNFEILFVNGGSSDRTLNQSSK